MMEAGRLKHGIIVAVCACLLVLQAVPLRAHGSGHVHVLEMYSVLPFKAQASGRATPENQPVADWLGMITSDLIDNYWGAPCSDFGDMTFYDYLREEFGFRCKHRLLFHWGFNARPWSDALERKISKYEWYSDPEEVARFKQAFVTEQKRRNGRANAATEKLFGFSSSGKESAWANGILAIVYDVHLLGDWVPYDNSDFEGVTPPSVIVGDIVNAIRRIDNRSCKPFEKELMALAKNPASEQELAELLIAKLQERMPDFLLSANDGALKQKFEAQGFTFR